MNIRLGIARKALRRSVAVAAVALTAVGLVLVTALPALAGTGSFFHG